MTSVEVLARLGLLSWHVLLLGWEKGWVTRDDIIDYAVHLLAANKDQGDENIAAIAAGENYSNDELKQFITSLTKHREGGLLAENAGAEIEKWRLAQLISINESELSEEEKLQRLQDVYAEFGYPEDMASCSIYSQDNIDPLLAMVRVITALKEKFQTR